MLLMERHAPTSRRLIHPSAWKGNSANFAFWGFSEVLALGSSFPLIRFVSTLCMQKDL